MIVLVWNTYPKEFCKLWPILLRCYSMKVKISKDCKYEMQKRKEEVNSWHLIYLVILVGTKLPLVHVVETLHTRVLLLGNQVSPKSFTWLVTKVHHEGTRQAPLVTLIPPALRNFSTKGGGLHVSCTKCPRFSTPSWRVEDSSGGPKAFNVPYNLIHLRIISQGWHTLCTTQL
jgi:hypothetical protein